MESYPLGRRREWIRVVLVRLLVFHLSHDLHDLHNLHDLRHLNNELHDVELDDTNDGINDLEFIVSSQH